MFHLKKKFDFAGYTAIIPAVAVGNVAQLAVDLIVATLELERIGNGWHPIFMPIFGPAAYRHDPNSKTTAFEVYGNVDKKIVLLQIRAPIIKRYVKNFHDELAAYLAGEQFSKVLILSSSHLYEKHDIETSPFQYICNNQFESNFGRLLNNLGWTEFEGGVLYGGGNAQKLLEACDEQMLPSLILFKFVCEGDNSSDASEMVTELNKLQPLFPGDNPVKLTIPMSWNLLYGNDPPEFLF